MESAVVKIKKGQGRSLKAGGMWIYDNEIDTITGTFQYPPPHFKIRIPGRMRITVMQRYRRASNA